MLDGHVDPGASAVNEAGHAAGFCAGVPTQPAGPPVTAHVPELPPSAETHSTRVAQRT
jgi:hypothetical protein